MVNTIRLAISELKFRKLEPKINRYFLDGEGASVTDEQLTIVSRTTMTDERVLGILKSALENGHLGVENFSAAELRVFLGKLKVDIKDGRSIS